MYPAGTFNRAYVDKLARIDYGSEADGSAHPFVALLGQIRRELAPRWILIDAGAGFGEGSSGFRVGESDQGTPLGEAAVTMQAHAVTCHARAGGGDGRHTV